MSVILALGRGRAQVGGPGVQGYPHVCGEFEGHPWLLEILCQKEGGSIALFDLSWDCACQVTQASCHASCLQTTAKAQELILGLVSM